MQNNQTGQSSAEELPQTGAGGALNEQQGTSKQGHADKDASQTGSQSASEIEQNKT